MGRSPSASVESHSREDLDIMLRFVIVLSLAIMVHGAPSGGHTGYGYQTQHCQTKYHTKYEQECHTEYVVVDTTYTQECRDIVTQHCTKTHTAAHVVSHGHGYGKREAEPGYSSGGYSRSVCQQSVERQCQDVPHQTERKVPRQVCTPVEMKVPYQVCANSHVAVSQYHNTGYGHVYAHH